MAEHIYPVFDQILTREDRQRFLRQRSKVIWLTGLSGSGKTTIAKGLERDLYDRGFLSQVLDGDNIRSGINSNLGFSEADRMENIRRIAEVSKLLINTGIITINSFISPTREIRHLARHIIGQENFVEVFINAPLEVCEQRDVKGLYRRAREGSLKNFTGIDSPFEIPENPDLVIDTSAMTIEACREAILAFTLPLVRYE